MLVRSIAFGVAMLAATASATENPALTGIEPFQRAYGMSFYGFDLCGEADLGQLYRKALREKVAHCPFTAEAKTSFAQRAADTDNHAPADLQRYIAEHDKLPESLDEKKVACRKEKDTPTYQKTVALLADYAKGTVRFDAVVPDACEAKAGGR
jgi:hypothetical protein